MTMGRSTFTASTQPTHIRRRAYRVFAMGLGLMLAAWSTAQFAPRASDLPTATGRAMSAPLPMRFFCASYPRECRVSPASRVVLTERIARLLRQVNADINASIRPQDASPGGWDIYPAAGDCNDYALTKRSALLRLGLPAGALRMAITSTRFGSAHAILLVRTDVGDLVLDNLSTEVKSLSSSGYTIRMMSGANPQSWVKN